MAEGASVLENGSAINKTNEILRELVRAKLKRMGISDLELGVKMIDSMKIHELRE